MKKRPNYCAYVDKGLRLNFQSNKQDQLLAGVRPCCMTHPDKIPNDHERYIPITNTIDLLNHPTRKHFQEWFESRKHTPTLHPACSSCTNLEKVGLASHRTNMNIVEHTNKDFNFLRLDVNLSNQCNLACVFCNSKASSLIETIMTKYEREDLPEHWKGKVDKQPKSEDIANVIASLLKTYKVKSLKVIGGEPFLAENWKPIENVLDEIDCSGLELEITTNGTIMNDEIIRRLSKTKRSTIRISCDGINQNYEFLRWPHTWKKMEKSLDFIFKRKSDVLKVEISLLVNIFNFEYLPKIEKYFFDKGWKFHANFDIKPDNSVLNCINLPNHLIDQIEGQIKNPDIKLVLEKLNRSKKVKRNLHDITRDTKFYLAQRNMKASDVFGSQTLEFLCL